jgi:hypothetical protein
MPQPMAVDLRIRQSEFFEVTWMVRLSSEAQRFNI